VRHTRGFEQEYSTEEDGYPIFVMESGVESFSDGAVYHEQRKIAGTAKTWEEALGVAGPFYEEDGDKLYEDSPLHGTLQDGEVPFWAVEVLTLLD
jgi:hypothetical protein